MRTLVGGILLAIGILIAGASGLCTVMFFVTTVMNGGGLGALPLVLLFGGVPFAIGSGLFFAGRSLIRSDREG
jgi:hypothetical protein